jgi:hypothetical protein
VNGQKTDEGYRFLSDIGISIQGKDSNGSGTCARHIAQKFGLPLSVTFNGARRKELPSPVLLDACLSQCNLNGNQAVGGILGGDDFRVAAEDAIAE